jgi:hypothetical protein
VPAALDPVRMQLRMVRGQLRRLSDSICLTPWTGSKVFGRPAGYSWLASECGDLHLMSTSSPLSLHRGGPGWP